LTDAAAFLAAITADPDADGPRLAYADWLDERGDAARAEFIRVQCALAKVDEDNRDIHPLAARERALLKRHREEWLRPLRDIVYPEAGGRFARWRATPVFAAAFRRGFPEAVLLPAARFLRYGADLFQIAPVREVELDYRHGPNTVDRLDDLARCPLLDRLTALRLRWAGLPAGEVRRLVRSEHLGKLRELDIHATEFLGDDLVGLAESPLLSRLRRLKLHAFVKADIGRTALAVLVEATACRGLTALGLCGDMVMGEADFQCVIASPHLENLTDLDLSVNLLGHHLSAALPRLRPALRRLALRESWLDDQDALALSRWPGARSLLSLKLCNNRITDAGALALADSPFLLAPTRIDLADNPISRQVKRALHIRLGDRVKV
jgi:uncharacterized protein (TIGR02996 family)